MAIELLQHALERFGVVTVLDVTLYEPVTNKPVLFLDTLKISNMNAEASEKEIRGGGFADLLITHGYARNVNFEFQDALLSAESMKHLWGAELERVAANIVEHKRQTVALSATKTVTLGALKEVQAVVNVTKGVEYIFDDEVTPANATFDFVDSTGVITVTDTAAVEGDQILVYYTVAADDTNFDPVEAIIKSNSFPKTVKLVGQTFFIEEKSGKQMKAEIEIPKLKLSANFSINMEAEGDASVFDFAGMALVSNTVDRDLVKIKILSYL